MCAASQIHSIFVIYWSDGVCIFRANNRITRISVEQLRPFLALETLDLSNNNIVDIKASSFPALPLKNLWVVPPVLSQNTFTSRCRSNVALIRSQLPEQQSHLVAGDGLLHQPVKQSAGSSAESQPFVHHPGQDLPAAQPPASVRFYLDLLCVVILLGLETVTIHEMSHSNNLQLHKTRHTIPLKILSWKNNGCNIHTWNSDCHYAKTNFSWRFCDGLMLTGLCVLQGAEQEPGSQGGGSCVPRSACSALAEDAEKRPQPPDGRGLLGPQQHGSPVSTYTDKRSDLPSWLECCLIFCVFVCVGLQAAGLQQPDRGEQGLALRPVDSAAAPPQPQRHQQDPTWRLGVLPETQRAVSPSSPNPRPPCFSPLNSQHFSVSPSPPLWRSRLPFLTLHFPLSRIPVLTHTDTHRQSSVSYALSAPAKIKALPAYYTPLCVFSVLPSMEPKTSPSGSPAHFSYQSPFLVAVAFSCRMLHYPKNVGDFSSGTHCCINFPLLLLLFTPVVSLVFATSGAFLFFVPETLFFSSPWESHSYHTEVRVNTPPLTGNGPSYLIFSHLSLL